MAKRQTKKVKNINNTSVTQAFHGSSISVFPRGPTHIFHRWVGLSDLFGLEILAKKVFFGSMKDMRPFLGCKKNRVIFLGLYMFSSASSNQ